MQDEEMLSEDEKSYQDSSSASDIESEEDDEIEEDSPESKERAMAEARQMLKDNRTRKRRRDYFEDEVKHVKLHFLYSAKIIIEHVLDHRLTRMWISDENLILLRCYCVGNLKHTAKLTAAC